MNKTRIIDYWNSDVASKYFANVGFSIKALNNKIEIDDANNILDENSLISGYPATIEGQQNYLIDLKNKSKKTIELVEYFEKLKNLEKQENSSKIIEFIDKKKFNKKKTYRKRKFFKKAK